MTPPETMTYAVMCDLFGWKMNSLRKLLAFGMIKSHKGKIPLDEVQRLQHHFDFNKWIDFCSIDEKISASRLSMLSPYHRTQLEKITGPNLTIAESLFWVKHQLTSFPKTCEECNAPITTFHTFATGYTNRFCSIQCKGMSKLVKDKVAATCGERYGTSNISQNLSVKSKKKSTMMQRFGASSPMTGTLRQKTITTFEQKYGTSVPTKNSGVIHKSKMTVKSKSFDKILVPTDYRLSFERDDYLKTGFGKYPIFHESCQTTFMAHLPTNKIECPACNKFGSRSAVERMLGDMLTSVPLQYGKQLQVNDKKIYPDITIGKLVVEIDGNYWHAEHRSQENKLKSYQRKRALDKIGVKSMFFFEDEIVHKREIVASMVLSKCGKYDKIIDARKCQLVNIDSQSAGAFLDDNHIQGRAGSSLRIGLLYCNELVAVATVGKSRFRKGHELIRLCFGLNTAVRGGTEKLIHHLKSKVEGLIYTYSDNRFGDGAVYQRCGAQLVSSNRPSYFYMHTSDYLKRHNRMRFQKHKLLQMLDSPDVSRSEWELAQQVGLTRIWDCGSKTWML